MSWKLPGYVVEELLGFGASGDVWRAHVSGSGEPVALKRIRISDVGQLQAARAEAALLSTLDHPHLIRLHELVPTPEAVVLVIDLAGGGSLADLLAQRGRLTPGEVITALAPVGAALAYAHNEGVVHGDVTPANVLFTEAGLPLLGDVGVARIVGDDAPARSTPAYLDPSVAAGCVPAAASDVFMLAAVALHALTGEPIWTAPDPARAVAQAAAGDVGDLARRLAGVPADLAAVVERGLAVEPHLRCTAAEFALDLRHSGRPTPVELAAGRARPLVVQPDHRSTEVPADTAHGYRAQHRLDSPAVAAPGRPSFDRPGVDGLGVDVPATDGCQLTHSVRAALRPVLPPPRRRAHTMLTHRATRMVSVVALALGVAVAAGIAWSAHRGDAAANPPAARTTKAPATSISRPVASTASAPKSGLSDAEAAGILRGLDRLREQAFAQNAPALLGRVYLPGPLLAQDSALLRRVVPAGCGLVGVHTDYSGVRASNAADGRIVVTATAVLATSILRCADATSGRAPAAGPTRLRIELARQRDGSYLIAAQRRG